MIKDFFKLKRTKIFFIILIFSLIFTLLFIYSINVRGRSFYGDDLLDYNDYLKYNFFDFVFNRTKSYLRPFSFSAIYLSDFLFDIDFRLSAFFNVVLFLLALITMFFVVKKLTCNNVYLSILIVTLFSFSFLNFYHIAWVLGAMESLSLLFLFLIIYFLLKYKENPLKIYNVYLSCLFFIILFLTCERFFFVCFIISFSIFVIAKSRKEKIIFTSIPLLLCFALFVVKTLILKIPFIKQTAEGSLVFNLNDMISQGLKALLQTFQIPWNFNVFQRMNAFFQIISVLNGCIIILFFILSLYIFIKKMNKNWKNNIFNLSFIIFFVLNTCMMSLTKNVMSRHLSSAYACLLFFIVGEFYCINNLTFAKKTKKEKNIKPIIYFACFLSFVLNDIGLIKKNNGYHDLFIKAEILYNDTYIPYKKEYKTKPLLVFAETEVKNYYCFKDYWFQFKLSKGYTVLDLNEKEKKISEMSIEERNNTVMITVDNNYKCERMY